MRDRPCLVTQVALVFVWNAMEVGRGDQETGERPSQGAAELGKQMSRLLPGRETPDRTKGAL